MFSFNPGVFGGCLVGLLRCFASELGSLALQL